MIRKLGLITPPKGFVSKQPPLLGAESPVDLLSWNEIIDVAKSGRMDGRKKYGSDHVVLQKHNNCAGASASRIVEKAYRDLTGRKVELSQTYTYSRINGGRDQGSMLADAMLSIERDGVCTAATCGPDTIYRDQYQTQRADSEAKRWRVLECYAIRERDLTGDEVQRSIWTALALGFKVGVAVHVGSRFDKLSSEGIAGVDRGNGNHAVESDGIAYEAGKLVATAENTWGQNWGRAGRMLLIWDHFVQTVGVHEFYAARSAAEDPANPDRPPEVRA